MQYEIDYQYLPKGAVQPRDDGQVVGIKATDKSGIVVLPNVGDFVHIDNSADCRQRGRVRSRAFFYTRTHDDVFCYVNIVVEETDDDWGMLIKR